MFRVLAGIIIGLISALLWPTLPANWIGLSILILGACAISRASFVSGLLIGAALCILLVNHQFNDLSVLFKANSSIKGTVISLPQQGKFSNRFNFRITTIGERQSNARAIVYWPGQIALKLGDRILINGRVKPIHGMLNQGGFNYQRWLVANGFCATIIVEKGQVLEMEDSWSLSLKERFNQRLTTLSHRKYIQALAFGDRSLFDDASWQTLKVTGTGHLFAISGLHLSLLALFCFTVCKTVGVRICPNILLPYINISCSVISLMVCFGYADLSGFALPTMRAFIMLSVLLAFSALKQRVGLGPKLATCLLVVLLISPTAILSASFWLSFGAISIIYMMLVTCGGNDFVDLNWWQKIRFWLAQLIRLQLWLFVGLLGINITFFAGISLIAPVANLIAVPLVSFIILPLVLLALVGDIVGVSDSVVDTILRCANQLFSLLFELLNAMQQLDFMWLSLAKPHLSWLVLMGVLVGVLLWQRQRPISMPVGSMLALSSIVTALYFYQPSRNAATWTVNFLDVGQGNAAVIIKHGHAIIIDTGKIYAKGSVASRIIVPYLKSQGVNSVDLIMVTHDDNDHSGGLDFLAKNYPTAKLISNQSIVGAWKTQSCESLTEFSWMGLTLKFARAPNEVVASDNDRSCLIRINDNNSSVLFVGDTQKNAEKYWVAELTDEWQSDVLQLGHHGSKTSSSSSFLSKINPSLAIISYSRFNQWDFPHPQVMRRLRKHGINSYATSVDGQISVRFNANGYNIVTYRHNIGPFWYNRDLSFGHYD